MKYFIFTGIIVLSSLFSIAQDFNFAKPDAEEFSLKKYTLDTSANAVVLKEFGTAYISSTEGNLIFEYHARIKIFNSKGFKYGNVEIPLFKSDANTFEMIRDIKAVTFYRDENGLTQLSELDPKQIFTETKAGKNYDLKKFALPNLRNGSIIEYSYIIQSPFIRHYRNWQFQTDIPKIHSEYCAKIPAVYNYNIILRGPLKLTKTNAELLKECYQPGAAKIDCSKMTYIMDDVPAFIEEDYMTAAANFRSAMYFELSEYQDYYGTHHKLSTEWKDIDKDLHTSEWFGAQLKKTDFLKEKVVSLVADKGNELDKAKTIYTYMQSWFKWNNYSGKYTDLGVKKAFTNRTGNAADINLTLITALRSIALDAEPVILSTRANGAVNNVYPSLSDFDYVICKLNIGQESYLLDATDPLLPFGLLPLRCLNEKGRVISFKKPSDWIDIKASQKETKTIHFNLELDASGYTKGSMAIMSSGYEAYEKRASIKKFNSVEEYVENLDERLPKIKLNKSSLSNLDSLDSALGETYEIEISNTDKNEVHINPHFVDPVNENPFKLLERTYPVDMGAPSETRIMMQLKFPENYEVINKPGPLAVGLPNQGGKLISKVSIEGSSLTLSYMMQLSKSIYSPEEYFYLKELFNKVLATQQADIILKKKI